MVQSGEKGIEIENYRELNSRKIMANDRVNSDELLFEIFLKLLNYKQAAQCLSISEPYLRRLKSRGQIPWVQMGKRGVRFNPESLKKWVRDREIK